MVDVFPINTAAFGFRSDWFSTFVPRFIRPSYLLMVLMLILAIGIMVLKRFEDADLEKKLWNIPIIIVSIAFWPFLIVGLKNLVDSFNTFLIQNIFQIPWQGFGFPELSSISQFVGWSAEGIARLLPNLAYWIIYAFFLIFFFFYAVLGPLMLARGILYDEIDGLLEIGKELLNLFLWQTTVVILVAFIMPDIVSGKSFPAQPSANFYFLSLVLGAMIFFVPSITRKFGTHLGAAFVPLGFRWGGTLLGLAAFGKIATMSLSAAGLPRAGLHWEKWKHRILTAEEFKRRYHHRKHIQELEQEKYGLQHKLNEEHEEEEKVAEHSRESLLDLAKKAKEESARGEE